MSVRWSIYDDLEISPPPLIPFETQGIPDSVLRFFREAVVCHSVKCYSAAAIMIRRTLEQICSDRGATGSNLFKRIEDLGSKIILPQELREALHELRLLGNDAAHIEAETYTKISEEEILVAVEFTKEILKATYQYSELLTRMRGLKKDAKPNAPTA
jgi:hypothetical protein